jgi:TRAP-type uncharacterized transport system substrate-binding protein
MKVIRLAQLCLVSLALVGTPASAQLIRLMSGPQGGSWYPLAGAIQGIIEKNVPGTSVQVAPGAGISNVLGVQNNKAEMGFGNSVSTYDGVMATTRSSRRPITSARSPRSTSSISISSLSPMPA